MVRAVWRGNWEAFRDLKASIVFLGGGHLAARLCSLPDIVKARPKACLNTALDLCCVAPICLAVGL